MDMIIPRCIVCDRPLVRIGESYMGCSVLGHGGLVLIPPEQQRVSEIRREEAEQRKKIREAFNDRTH